MWFFGSKKTDYTQDLQSNESNMKKIKAEIQRLNQYQRHYKEMTTYYLRSTLLIATAVLVFFNTSLPVISTPYLTIRLDVVLLWVFGYLLIMYGNWLLEYIYHRRIEKRRTRYTKLKVEQEKKIEEYKKATKFNETQELLRKYGQIEEPTKEVQRAPSLVPSAPNSYPVSPLSPSQSQKATFFDRVLDKIVGEEEFESKIALVCKQCYTHNGLCPPELYNTYIFKCRHCKFLNMGPSAISPAIHPSKSQETTRKPSIDKSIPLLDDKSSVHSMSSNISEKSHNSAIDNISVTSDTFEQ